MTATPAAAPDGMRYRLDARIATGGMGEVWRATDTVLDREVAVKILKHEYADDPAFRARFEAEARHAAALHHPHVASVFDFGELPADDGSGTRRPFLVMELVHGQPLSALLLGGEPMPPRNAADLLAQAADAIAAAHAIGIVHRDVKPANILVTPEGSVQITDFGIARAANAVSLTQTGQVVGTPDYLSPEQAEGRPATEQSDIYALGVVLYECLAGHRPFAADTPVATALAHLREPVPALPGNIPEHLRSATTRALAKDPAERFGSVADMASALRGATVESATLPPATQVLEPPVPAPAPPRRRGLPPWWPWVAAAVAVLLVIGLVSLLSDGGTENTAGDNPPAGQNVQAKDDRVRLSQAAYVGMKHDDARKQLESLGFDVTEEPRDNPGGHAKDTVASVDPHGLVEPTATITLAVWGAPPKPTPTAQPKDQKDKGGPSDKGEKHGKSKGKK